jgi:hypothetical protein
MTPVGFEPTVPASQRSHTYALDRATTGIGLDFRLYCMSVRNERCVERFYIDISADTVTPEG